MLAVALGRALGRRLEGVEALGVAPGAEEVRDLVLEEAERPGEAARGVAEGAAGVSARRLEEAGVGGEGAELRRAVGEGVDAREEPDPGRLRVFGASALEEPGGSGGLLRDTRLLRREELGLAGQEKALEGGRAVGAGPPRARRGSPTRFAPRRGEWGSSPGASSRASSSRALRRRRPFPAARQGSSPRGGRRARRGPPGRSAGPSSRPTPSSRSSRGRRAGGARRGRSRRRVGPGRAGRSGRGGGRGPRPGPRASRAAGGSASRRPRRRASAATYSEIAPSRSRSSSFRTPASKAWRAGLPMRARPSERTARASPKRP